jgi:hypothetical protein
MWVKSVDLLKEVVGTILDILLLTFSLEALQGLKKLL